MSFLSAKCKATEYIVAMYVTHTFHTWCTLIHTYIILEWEIFYRRDLRKENKNVIIMYFFNINYITRWGTPIGEQENYNFVHSERGYRHKIKTVGSTKFPKQSARNTCVINQQSVNQAIWKDGGSVHSYRKLYVIQLVIRFKRLAVLINETDKHFNSKYQLEINDTICLDIVRNTVLCVRCRAQTNWHVWKAPEDCFTNIQTIRALKI